MKVEGVRCNLCKEFIWSRTTHDFHSCPCGATFIDGGRAYLRFGWSREAGKPEIETQEVDADAPHPLFLRNKAKAKRRRRRTD